MIKVKPYIEKVDEERTRVSVTVRYDDAYMYGSVVISTQHNVEDMYGFLKSHLYKIMGIDDSGVY